MKAIQWMTMSLAVFLLTAWAEIGFAAFSDNGNGTVSDSVTGLMWQQSDDGTERT